MRQKITLDNSGFSEKEWRTLKSLSTPAKIQDFLNSLPFNFEKKGETHNSVRETLKAGKAHCFEGALIAAAALWIQGRKPLILDLVTVRPDFDHVVALFKEGGYWGAISKTNHNVLRYREPIYRDIRELAVSYFHEYFLADGKKTLRKFSEPFDLSEHGTDWLIGDENLAWLAHELDTSKHFDILPKNHDGKLRKADEIEVEATGLEQYRS